MLVSDRSLGCIGLVVGGNASLEELDGHTSELDMFFSSGEHEPER